MGSRIVVKKAVHGFASGLDHVQIARRLQIFFQLVAEILGKGEFAAQRFQGIPDQCLTQGGFKVAPLA